MNVANQLKKIGTHLFEAGEAGLDVLRENFETASLGCVIAGNERVGKTTLLYTAKYGPNFNKKLLVPTVGYNMEQLDAGEQEVMTVVDVGGGSRMGPLFYKHVADTDALLFVVRGDDPRFISAAWELYTLLCVNPDVHVSIVLSTDTSTPPEQSRLMARLLEKDALPPTRDTWKKILDLYDVPFTVDLWNADRAWTERKQRTASHGMPLPPTPRPLVDFHRRTWKVVRLPPCHALLREQAAQLFVDLTQRCRQ